MRAKLAHGLIRRSRR